MKIPLFRILICIVIFALSLYAYIDRKNSLTELRVIIPKLEKELRKVEEENTRLEYELAKGLSPDRLLELSERPEYWHLVQPRESEMLEISIGSE